MGEFSCWTFCFTYFAYLSQYFPISPHKKNLQVFLLSSNPFPTCHQTILSLIYAKIHSNKWIKTPWASCSSDFLSLPLPSSSRFLFDVLFILIPTSFICFWINDKNPMNVRWYFSCCSGVSILWINLQPSTMRISKVFQMMPLWLICPLSLSIDAITMLVHVIGSST